MHCYALLMVKRIQRAVNLSGRSLGTERSKMDRTPSMAGTLCLRFAIGYICDMPLYKSWMYRSQSIFDAFAAFLDKNSASSSAPSAWLILVASRLVSYSAYQNMSFTCLPPSHCCPHGHHHVHDRESWWPSPADATEAPHVIGTLDITWPKHPPHASTCLLQNKRSKERGQSFDHLR